MRHLIFVLTLCGAATASAVTATKEYVDRKDLAVASSATNLVASATNEISKAVTKAQSTADAAKSAAAKNAEAIADEATARESADSALTSVVAGKANANDVYKKTETYTQTEIDTKIAAATPSDYETVKAKVTANETAIATHAGDTANPHKVTAAQVGALTDSAAEAKYAQKTDVQWTNEYSRIGLYKGEYNCPMILAPGASSGVMFALGYKSTTAQISHLFPDGSDVMTYTRVSDILKDYVSSSKLTSTLKSYATANALADVKASIPVISATDATFSNAVLAVGLNIDTNSVAVLNEIAKDFGGFPLSAGETATTVGGLLAALTAGLAALKKSVSTLSSKVDDANAALEEVA